MSNIIASVQNPLVKHIVKLRNNRSYRYSKKQAAIEGFKMVREAGRESPLVHILAIHEDLIPEGVEAEETSLVSETVMKKISSVKTPEGVAAVVKMPPYSTLDGLFPLIALDGIGDPGNLGTLIRTALAFDWKGLFLLDNCCDPYNEKALRAAKGATFKIPLGTGNVEDLKAAIRKNRLSPLIADIKGEGPETFRRDQKRLLILGSEARGPSRAIRDLGPAVSIPMTSRMESLNVAVAGGILMYSLSTTSP